MFVKRTAIILHMYHQNSEALAEIWVVCNSSPFHKRHDITSTLTHSHTPVLVRYIHAHPLYQFPCLKVSESYHPGIFSLISQPTSPTILACLSRLVVDSSFFSLKTDSLQYSSTW
ncbi:hypothetical protein L873DRAFT_1079765 [Choiromyces venosus 120613-1]|uniref:Uncharacterized protein n=1 Tax=Choiromyces venosus 120613-1 TaxID=1336337 RepID=A0A3N4JI51_9PEZI|nr:hypothetical protein L873DRAFT_1079765 [Choiromyces venosus 120613-1]